MLKKEQRDRDLTYKRTGDMLDSTAEKIFTDLVKEGRVDAIAWLAALKEKRAKEKKECKEKQQESRAHKRQKVV